VKREGRKASLRSAIYTRVSTENGLEQEFNSLDNQREASEAYIRSQAHEGWKLIRDRYDDGGFSGGSMDRPALAKLLDDVRARRVDVIVVYKVDRLTRSLADFAKLVELFDEHDVSFISVTQAFNTTTSMGRLTLNMLLSFAQFEREITGERIRDKVAASKKRGIWMGGAVPFGYRVENRALHIVEEHAEFVRDLFKRYLRLGSVVRLKTVLDAENVRLPIRTVGTGKTTGGGLISRGHIYWILSNPIYVGRLRHKGQIHDGLHSAIIDLETWDRVQRRLSEQTQTRASPHRNVECFLAGKLFDDRGNRMGPSHAAKADGVGATTFPERSSKVATQPPDPSRASLRPRSRSRCSTRSKASPHPDARSMDLALCRLLDFRGGRSARPGNHAKRYPVMRTCSTRSSESRLARSRSRSGSASPLPSTA
jgi:site-specific DNA recombinase